MSRDSSKYNQIDILLNILNKIYDNREENDKKRDQIISFYTTFIGILITLIANSDSIQKISDVSMNFKICILLFILLVNFIVARIILRLRDYHIMYVNAIESLQRLMLNECFDGQDIQKTINQYYIKNFRIVKFDFKYICNSVEILFYIFYVEVSSLPVVLFFYFSNIMITCNIDKSILNTIVFFLYNTIFLYLLYNSTNGINEKIKEISKCDDDVAVEPFLDFRKL